MGQKFYFDLTNGEDFVRDDEGVDASDLDEAITEARTALNELPAAQQPNMPGVGWKLVIRDEDGTTLKTLPLDDSGLH